MKKFYRNFAAAFIVTAILFTSVSAFAFPILANELNGVFFRNSESLIDRDRSGTVSVGDVFWGVMSVQNIVAPTDVFGQSGPDIWRTGDVPQEITGYFATEVTYAGVATNPLNVPYEIQFGPTTNDPYSLLSNNEAILIFEDTVDNYDDTTQTLGHATATDGTLAFSLGFTDADTYWYTPNLTEEAITMPGTIGKVGESYAGLDFIQLPTFGFDDVNDPSELWYDTFVNFWFNSEIFDKGIFGTPNTADAFHFGSNDPAVFFPVPEPSTFLLLGAGILGILVVGRKRKRD